MSTSEHKPLIPLTQGEIGGSAVPTVDGRTLHTFLDVGKDFTTWMKDRISQYGFDEGRDYVSDLFPNIGEKGQGRPSKEYHLTLDMAKELAMVERNAKGKEARLYFIECERIAKNGPAATDPLSVLADPDALRGLLFDYAGRVKAQAEEIALLAPKADALDRIAEADGSHCITDTAKLLQVRPKDLFAYLTQHSWIYRRTGSDHWCAYQAHIASGDMVHKVTTVLRPDGTEKTTEQVRVTPKGLAKLAKLMAPAVRLVPPAPVATLPGLCA
jgi:phage anti-repressor protein/phage antirepressor YoqD-like protein